MTLTEFLLARITEDEALLDDEDRVYGGGGEVWTKDAHARAVAECEAKRRIVALHEAGVRAVGEGLSARTRQACQALAAVYADHADYQPEWKP